MILAKTTFNSKEKVWSGPVTPPIFHQDASVGQVLQLTMNQHQEKPSQIFQQTGETWTHKDFHNISVRIAKSLLKLNMTQDDIIGICASNTPYLPAVAVAAFLIGTPISTLDPSFDVEGIKHIYGITKPSIIFCDRAILEKMKISLNEIKLECSIIVVDEVGGLGTIGEFLKESEDDSFRALPLKYGGDQVAAILCSSGSTGLPKGVTLSHKALINCLFAKVNSSDRILSFSTLYWFSGLYCLYMGLFTGACRIITNKPFSEDLFIDMIEKLKVSFVFGPPSQMALLVQSPRTEKADLSCLKYYLVGGSAVPFQVIEKLKQLIPSCTVTVGYGMTEIGGAISCGSSVGPNSNGHLIENIQMKVVDDNGDKLGIGETGEILLKSLSKWNGYYGNSEATANTLDNGWIKTGDLGYVDKDGNIYIVDRKKEILKYKNFHYSPTEIESVILDLPDIVEVCVFGFPDLVMTDLPAAAIVKKPGSSLTEKDVYDHVAKRMADFKQLRGGVYFVNSIPKTASGKIVRNKVKNLAIEMGKKEVCV